MVVLPSTFSGSPRSLKQNFIDSMTIVQKLGKPDLFITMTCNPKWKEIVENLCEHEDAIDRPDLVATVFHHKIKECLEKIVKNGLFGKCIAYTYVIEFQKRGLPHMHMLLFLDYANKIYTEEQVDKLISAEIPDKNVQPRLCAIVRQFMIHGPCGDYNMNLPCMNNDKKKCSKNFPKLFNDKTNFNTSGYPTYRRRNDGKKKCSKEIRPKKYMQMIGQLFLIIHFYC